MLLGELGVNHGVELNEALLEHSAKCIATTDERLGRKTDIQILQGNGLHVSVEPGCGWVDERFYLTVVAPASVRGRCCSGVVEDLNL